MEQARISEGRFLCFHSTVVCMYASETFSYFPYIKNDDNEKEKMRDRNRLSVLPVLHGAKTTNYNSREKKGCQLLLQKTLDYKSWLRVN